jgi:hypothetical protein
MQPEVESRAIAASYRSLCLYERYIRAKESCPIFAGFRLADSDIHITLERVKPVSILLTPLPVCRES